MLKKLKTYINKNKNNKIVISLDIETSGLDPIKDTIEVLSIGCNIVEKDNIHCEPFIFILQQEYFEKLIQVQKIFELIKNFKVIIHNAKFEYKFFKYQLKLNIYDIFPEVLDSFLLGTVYKQQLNKYDQGRSGSLKLGDMILHHLNIEIDKEEQLSDWTKRPITKSQVNYCKNDVLYLADLYRSAIRKVHSKKALKLEENIVEIIGNLELAGMKFNVEKANILHDQSLEKVKEKFENLKVFINKIDGSILNDLQYNGKKQVKLSFNSPKQIKFIANRIQQKYAMKTMITSSNKKTQEEILSNDYLYCKKLQEFIRLLIDYREETKLESMIKNYTKKALLYPDHRIRSSYNQNYANSSRMSCSSPNLQQVTKGEMRSLFYPDPSNIYIKCDFSQMELRILAHLTKDQEMIKLFKNGGDLHLATASKMFNTSPEKITKEQRNKAKTLNFGLIYGMGSYSVSKTLKVDEPTAIFYIKQFKNLYKQVGLYMDNATPESYIYTIATRRKMYTETYTQNLNIPIQSTGAEILKLSLHYLNKAIKENFLKDQVLVVNLIHDEIIIEVPAIPDLVDLAGKILKESMEKAGNSIINSVDMVAEVELRTENWNE